MKKLKDFFWRNAKSISFVFIILITVWIWNSIVNYILSLIQ